LGGKPFEGYFWSKSTGRFSLPDEAMTIARLACRHGWNQRPQAADIAAKLRLFVD